MLFLLSKLQYHTKVSYRLSSRFCRDKTLVLGDECLISRESLKHIFWNKLEAIMLQKKNGLSLACVFHWLVNATYVRRLCQSQKITVLHLQRLERTNIKKNFE